MSIYIMCVCMYVCIHTSIYISIYIMCVCMYVCIHTYMYKCANGVYIHIYILYIHMCVCVCVCVCVWRGRRILPALSYTYIHANIHACMHIMNMHITCLDLYIYTYVHTYIHTYIHTNTYYIYHTGHYLP